MKSGISHQDELENLGREIVLGSSIAMEAKYKKAIKDFELWHGFGPDAEALERILLDNNIEIEAVWGLGPSGASEIGKTDVISLSEFVGGIAVAKNIHPEQRDIDTVIFFIGAYAAAVSQAITS